MSPSVCTANINLGKSFTLVGYLLFYLISIGARVIIQTENLPGIVGSVFDAKGVREIPVLDAWIYDDGKPCYLLVSADGPLTSPSPALAFCTATIVVTSPNLQPKLSLNAWQKQYNAYQFVAPPPSCPEVVYLLYVECFKLLLLVCLLSPLDLGPKFGSTTATLSIGCIENGPEISDTADVITKARFLT
jgi:hypothetical protein